MPRNERSVFSSRPEGPQTSGEIAQERARRAIPKTKADEPLPWETERFKDFLKGLPEESDATMTPVPQTVTRRVQEMRLKKPNIASVIHLKHRVEERRAQEARFHPDDAREYDQDINALEAVIAGLREHPDDLSLAQRVAEFEQRYHG